MSVNVVLGGVTYPIPNEAGESGWSNLTDYLVALASSTATTGPSKQSIRIDSGTTSVFVTITDSTVICTGNTANVITVFLPTGVTKQIFTIVDGQNASQYQINVQGNMQNINGSGTYSIRSQRGAVTLQYDGTEWKVLSDHVGSNPSFSGLKLYGLSTGIAHIDSTGLFTSSLVSNSDISASAGIQFSKMQALTASVALMTNASGFAIPSPVTSTELGYVAGASSSLQTQINGKQASGALLTSIQALASNGFVVRTGAGAAVSRVLAVGSTRLSLSNTDGSAGNPTFDAVEANFTLSNLGGILAASKGGTGINSSATFPSIGTIVTQAATESLSNKTLDVLRTNSTNDASTGASVLLSAPSSSLRFLSNAGLTSVTGITSPNENRFSVIYNGTGNSVSFFNDTGGLAADRIITGTGSTLFLAPNASIWVAYNSLLSRNIIVGGSGGSSVTKLTAQVLAAGGQISGLIAGQYQLDISGSAAGENILNVLPFGSTAPADLTLLTIVGTSSANVPVINTNDASGGFVGNGQFSATRYATLRIQYLASVLRWVEIARTVPSF